MLFLAGAMAILSGSPPSAHYKSSFAWQQKPNLETSSEIVCRRSEQGFFSKYTANIQQIKLFINLIVNIWCNFRPAKVFSAERLLCFCWHLHQEDLSISLRFGTKLSSGWLVQSQVNKFLPPSPPPPPPPTCLDWGWRLHNSFWLTRKLIRGFDRPWTLLPTHSRTLRCSNKKDVNFYTLCYSFHNVNSIKVSNKSKENSSTKFCVTK